MGKLTDWKNPPKYEDLKADRDMAETSHSAYLAELEEYRETLDGGPEIKTAEGRSNIRPLLALKLTEWQIPMIEEPFLSTRNLFQVKPRTASDSKAAEWSQVLLNYYFNMKMHKVSNVNSVSRTLVREGTVTVKNGWYTQEEEIEVEVEKPIYATAEQSYNLITRAINEGKLDPSKGQAMLDTGELLQIGVEIVKETKTIVVENHPTIEVLDNESVIVDPTAKGRIENANFIIHEYETDFSAIKSDEYDPETGNGMYKNLDELERSIVDGDERLPINVTNEPRVLSNTMRFTDRARKKITVSEYWGYWDIDGNGIKKPIVATWASGVLIRLEENPYAHKKLPFSKTTYMPVKDSYYGIPDCKLTKSNQESVGKMTRAYHDMVTAKATGQTLIAENAFNSPAEWDAYYRGDHARFNPGVNIKQAIHTVGADPIDSGIFQVLDRQTIEAETITGSRPFNSGSLHGLGSATAERNAMDAVSKRTLSVLRRISSELWEDAARMILQNAQAYLSEDEVIRITESDHVTLNRKDIKGEFDLIVEISTPEKDAEQAQQLMTLLQTNQANMDIELQKIFYRKLLLLWNHPEEADIVKKFEPKPNPAQEELANIQLENARLQNEMLKMDMAKRMSEIEKNNADTRIKSTLGVKEVLANIDNKNASAEEMRARRELLKEQADLTSQEFIYKHTGKEREHAVEDLVYKEESKSARETARNKTMLENPVYGETNSNSIKKDK